MMSTTARNAAIATTSVDRLAMRNPSGIAMARQMGAFLNLTRLLNSRHRLEQQLAVILGESNRILDTEHTFFYLRNAHQQELWAHFLSHGRMRQVRQPLEEGLPEHVIDTGRIVNLPEVSTPTSPQRLGASPIRNTLAVPIVNRSGGISGALQAVNKRRGAFDQKDTDCLLLLADLIALAIQNALRDEAVAESRRLEQEISRAVEIQRQLLPSRTPQIPGYGIFAFNQPSKYVGGDYYDFFPRDNATAFVLADVAGKGVPAALLTANLHASLHACAEGTESCTALVGRINRHFHRHTASDMFATFFWGTLDHRTHRFRYVNAGHLPPLLVRRDGRIEKLRSGGLPIGIMAEFEYAEAETRLLPGDTLLVFSDGITEVCNGDGEMFGKRELRRLLEAHPRLAPRELGKVLLQRLRKFSGTRTWPDDMTLMIVHREA